MGYYLPQDKFGHSDLGRPSTLSRRHQLVEVSFRRHLHVRQVGPKAHLLHSWPRFAVIQRNEAVRTVFLYA